ncbi:uncharacterized protein V6R79_017353 [Siganus canaliculatus]
MKSRLLLSVVDRLPTINEMQESDIEDGDLDCCSPTMEEYLDSIKELSQPAPYPLHGPLRGHRRWTERSRTRVPPVAPSLFLNASRAYAPWIPVELSDVSVTVTDTSDCDSSLRFNHNLLNRCRSVCLAYFCPAVDVYTHRRLDTRDCTTVTAQCVIEVLWFPKWTQTSNCSAVGSGELRPSAEADNSYNHQVPRYQAINSQDNMIETRHRKMASTQNRCILLLAVLAAVCIQLSQAQIVPGRCSCYHTIKFIAGHISDFHVLEKRPGCDKTELIVALNNPDKTTEKYCMNTEGKMAKAFLRCWESSVSARENQKKKKKKNPKRQNYTASHKLTDKKRFAPGKARASTSLNLPKTLDAATMSTVTHAAADWTSHCRFKPKYAKISLLPLSGEEKAAKSDEISTRQQEELHNESG